MTKSDSSSIKSKSISIKSKSSNNEENEAEKLRQKFGLSLPLATFFMIAQMAGAGFLALPRAMADAGWIGIVCLILFCGGVGFAATRLGVCWTMLEERYPEYRKPSRQPYIEIAHKSLGLIGRRVALTLILISNIGSTTVFIILISELVNSIFDQLSTCEYALIVGVVVMPLTWLGSPKDFWQASVMAVVSTFVTILIIIVKYFLDFAKPTVYPLPTHPNPTIQSFSLGFGAILYSFGGMAVFPTIQNDMKERTQFWKSTLVSFSTILMLYFPIALFGYIYIGDSVESNVILSFKSSPSMSVAIAFEVFNLLGTYIIALSPVFQALEDIAGVPPKFGIKRIMLRSSIIIGQLIIALGFPDFGLVVNLIGGSAIAALSFVLPPLMYIRLVDDKSHKDCPDRSIPLWERCLLWEIFLVGIVGGLLSTVTSLYNLLKPEQFQSSCFADFLPE